jgi:hypothetical protein
LKLKILRTALITSLTFSLFQTSSSAETNRISKCSYFGVIKPNENPSFQHINCLLTEEALRADIPPEVVKAVVTQENGNWVQFDSNGNPFFSDDGGIGLMQITNHFEYDQQRLKYDIKYNIEKGIEILSEMYSRKDLPKIKDAGRKVIENWYFPIMAYNGIKPVNSPTRQDNGEKNNAAYQEEVFAKIERNSFIDDTKLAEYPFSKLDFQYDPLTIRNIVFLKKEYILTEQTHTSAYFLKSGDKAFVTEHGARLRLQPSLQKNEYTTLAENSIVMITGDFEYDQSQDSTNQYVWLPVQTEDGRKGYISSAYIAQLEDLPNPSIPEEPIDSERPMIMGIEDKAIKVGEKFDDKEEVTADDLIDGDLTSKISVASDLNTKKPGNYTLVYKVADSAGNVTVETRLITVIDDKNPVISGVTTKTINMNSSINLRTGIFAKDNVDGDLTKAIKVVSNLNNKKPGVYKITYSVTDSSGNKITVPRTIMVKDHIRPEILGATAKTIKLNSTFNSKSGVTAKDNVDGNITNKIKVTGNVNSKKKGKNILTYTVTDKSGNKAVITRIIIVK